MNTKKNFPKNFFKNPSISIWQYFLKEIENKRLLARSTFNQKPLNIATLLSILPFLIGFFQFIQQKYQFAKTPLILEKNIPALKVPTENLSLETIEYLNQEKKLQFLLQKGKSYWSDRSVICQIDSNYNKKSIFFKDQKFITKSNRLNFFSDTSSINAKFFSLISNPNSINYNTEYYSNLDELPNKLETNFIQKINLDNLNQTRDIKNKLSQEEGAGRQITKKPVDFTIPAFFKIKSTSSFKFKKLNTVTPNLNKVSDSKFNLITRNLEKSEIYKSFYGTEFLHSHGSFSKDSVLKTRKKFLSNSNLLKNEYKKIFLINGQIPIFKTETFKKSNFLINNLHQSNLFEKQDKKVLLTILSEINKLSISKDWNSSRKMSGYQFPDMPKKTISWFLIEKNFFLPKIKQNLQISLPSNFSTIQNNQTPSFKKPELFVETKSLVLRNIDTNDIVYQGPAILTNSEQNYDWNIRPKNHANIGFRDWLNFYLSNSNPFSDSFINFFGIYSSPEFNQEFSQKQNSKTNYWFNELPFYRNGIIGNSETNFLPFERSFQIPYISENEWKLNFPNNNELVSDKKEFTEISLPLLETRIPKVKSPRFLFGLNTSLDYEFKLPYPDVQSDFIPEVCDSLTQENFGTKYSSGNYQRINSTFKLKTDFGNNFYFNSYTFFSDLWEPLTFRSWLLISQVGFAFLVFSILKALADNYGRELLVYLLDLVALLGFLDDNLKQEIEILMGQREKGFRIITKTNKSFKDIAGIENLLPEIVEIVWFLRNSGREFSLSKTLPRGVLLTGPPGTGKTLLVQALAGEADVPVLALSGSSLIEPGESGALKLEILFQEARRLAPCIVFIDEIDTLAEKRQQVLQNPMGADELLESLHGSGNLSVKQKDIQKILTVQFENSEIPNDGDSNENLVEHQDMQREKLRILMQFLVELDGIQGRDGVVVIGATNRSEMLDPAILRPGRFDRIVELSLPGPEKRKDILKLYSINLGTIENFSWDYLASRTAGFSAADLASIMNQSSLRAITLNTQHTIETIEHGIDRITTFELEKPKNIKKTNLTIVRRSYYQSGKIILSMLLEHHPPTLITYLWPRTTNMRAFQISTNVQKYFFKFARRVELEHRLIGCYAGKAAEILLIERGLDELNEINISDLGIDDIQFGQNLINFMTETWYLYSQKTLLHKVLNVSENHNIQEYQDNSSHLSVFQRLNDLNESSPLNNNFENSDFNKLNSNIENPLKKQSQNYFSVPWWQYQISNEFEITTRFFADWYRLYLPDPQETERNLEWIPPDEFYQNNNLLNYLAPSINWNSLDLITTDYQKHSLILQSFNLSLRILEENRELLDYLSFELIENEILRKPKIEKICNQFNLGVSNDPSLKFFFTTEDENLRKSEVESKKIQQTFSEQQLTKKLLSPTWGQNSRRKVSRWINLEQLK